MTIDDTLTSANGDDAQVAEHLQPYLEARADRIPTGSPDVERVIARAGQRRRRRVAGVAVAAACVLGIGTVGVIEVGQRGPTVVDSANLAPTTTAVAVAASLNWSTVTPRSGLFWNQANVTAGGATYGLSTAPGPAKENGDPGSVLYRSTDNREWTPVAVPGDFHTSGLAGGTDRLYAVGTVPAGGSMGVSLVQALATGEVTAPAKVPVDLAALERTTKLPLTIVRSSVANVGGTVVVTATVALRYEGLGALLPAGTDTSDGVGFDESGVILYGTPTGTSDPSAGTTVPPTGAEPTPPPATGVPVEKQAPMGKQRFAWSDLGITPDAVRYATGTTLAFSSTDGMTFAPLTLPAGARGQVRMFAAAGGFRLIASPDDGGVQIWSSPDAVTWSAVPFTIAGQISQAGIMGDQLVIITQKAPNLSPVVHVQQPDGTWTALDLALVPGVPADNQGVPYLGIGPLGIAAVVVQTYEPASAMIVYSPDGVSASVSALPSTADGQPVSPQSVIVGADAVTVSLSIGTGYDPNAAVAAPMKLFVGVRP